MRASAIILINLLVSALTGPLCHAATTQQTCDSPRFAGARVYPAAVAAQIPAIGDFNGDGFKDVAVTDSLGVSILLNNGDGTFTAGATYKLGNALWVVTADFNGDGKLDLAVAANSAIQVMLGNGDGTFKTPIITNASTSSIAVGDFNGDGIPDLAIESEPAEILLGKGDGTFILPPPGGQGSGYTEGGIVVGDFNGDGNLDVVVGSIYGGFYLLLGDGKGNLSNLSAPTSVSDGTSFGPVAVVAADVNGDHILDVITVGNLSNSVSIMLGVGNGTFQGPITYSTGMLPTSVAIADYTGDGIPDLAVSNQTSPYQIGTISLYPGHGDGTFQQPVQLNPTDQPNWAVAASDFNNDGTPDLLIVANTTTNPTQVGVMLGTPNGMLQGPNYYAVGMTPQAPALADFNGDGRLDVAVVGSGFGGNLSVLLGNGDGTLQAASTYTTAFGSHSVAAGDFNGDGKPDLVVANGTGANVLLFLGNGDGTFQAAKSVGSYFAGTNYIAAGDFNNDGTLDFAVSAIGGVSIQLGNGDGTFHAGTGISTLGCFGCMAGPIALADVNGDGFLDVVLANGAVLVPPGGSSVGTITVYLGKGNGSFQSGVNYTIGYTSASVAIGDINGDGKPDIVAADSGGGGTYPPQPGGLAVLLGNGDGTFQNAVRYASANLNWVAMADFNGDSFPDVAAASNNGQTITVFLSNGDGTLRNAVAYGAGGGPPALAIGDLNGDGKPDLVFSDDIANTVFTMLNSYVPGISSVCIPAPLAASSTTSN